MKKLFTLCMIVALTISVFAQSPQRMSYQAVIRNSSDQLVTSHAIGMRISILQGSATGTPVYVETQTPTTNANGLVSLEIGGGTIVTGTFAGIDWSNGSYFIKTEADPTGGTSYTITGTSQVLSVPYALYSETAKTADYNNLTNKPVLFDGTWINITGKPTTLAGYGITNAMSTAHPANGITSTMISNWNTAYGWGNHSGLYRPITYVPAWSEITSKPTSVAGYGITDAVMTTGDQTITGTKTFSNDILVNGLTIGRGGNAGISNTAIGYSAFHSNTTGQGNIANGSHALFNNTTGSFNIAIGTSALFYNTTGLYNSANGHQALMYNTTGYSNTAIGYNSLFSNTIGSRNTAVGDSALYSNTTGYHNTAIGDAAGYALTTGNYNVFLGSNAGYYETGSNKLFIDNQQRANESDARVKSLIYGVFDANPANQILTINGNVGIGTNTTSSSLEVAGQIKIAGGTPAMGEVLTSDGTGLATWEPPAGNNHYIGENYGGGIIFYVYDNGQHGLIAAAVDQSIGRWYAGTTTNTMTKAYGVGAGIANTAIIIANQGYGDGTTYAARICYEYSVTVNSVTYGDWYLPSLFELNLLYIQKTVVGGFAGDVYWSSTEQGINAAYLQNLDNGNQVYDGKSATHYVRAVRAF